MTVLFPDVRDPNGGKSYFLHFLYKELEALGFHIVFTGIHDVMLGNIRFEQKSPMPKVLRLDGVEHNIKKKWREKNVERFNQVSNADVVICQSQFGYDMIKNFVKCDMGKAVIINNGANINAEYQLPKLEYEHNFLAVSKWRPHKRLTDCIESFLMADIPNSGLWVVGSDKNSGCDVHGYVKNHKNIKHVGYIEDRKILYGYMKEATASIHLCWFDCCPNSVVEAIAMKCPVICNNTGGTHEIVRPSGGTVINLDRNYNFAPIDLHNPPPVDRIKIAEAMWNIAKNKPEITNEHIDIKKIALQYKNVFMRLAR